MTISIFDDYAGAEESNRRGLAWTEQNLAPCSQDRRQRWPGRLSCTPLASSHFPESRCCRSRFTTAGRTSGRGILSAILRAMSLALGAFAPLRHSVFRSLWIANLASNTGIWLQNAGAGWLIPAGSFSCYGESGAV